MKLRIFALAAIPTLALTACRSTRPYSAAELRGRDLYSMHCYECHDTPQPGLLKTPPALRGLFSRHMLPSGLAPASDDSVREVIVHGRRTMPAFDGRLAPAQVSDLLAWLHRQ